MHPILLHVGPVVLPTYGVLAACGLMLALGLSQYTARLTGVDRDRLWDAGLFAVLAAFVLSRLLLVAQHWQSFVTYPVLLLAVPSLTAAGLALTLAATFAWMHFKRIGIVPALDAWAPCATLVWSFLALGHLAEGSDPGLPTSAWFGVWMPGEASAQHPVALYAAIVAAVLTLLLLRILRRHRNPGEPAALALGCTGLAQFLLSFLRLPGAPGLLGLDQLQIVALAMILAATLLWLTVSESQAVIPH